MNNDNEALRGQTNVHPSNNTIDARRADAGRPKLSFGQVGTINLKQIGTRVYAQGSTRDTAGKLRRIRASGSTPEEAIATLRARAARLGLVPGELSGASTLGELLDVWLREIVESKTSARRPFPPTAPRRTDSSASSAHSRSPTSVLDACRS